MAQLNATLANYATTTALTGAVSGISALGSSVRLCVQGGQYTQLQQAVDASADGDTILVGPHFEGGWGDVVLSPGKRLSIVGLGAARNTTVLVRSVTFDVSSGTNPNQNEVFLANLFISGDFSALPSKAGVCFRGSCVGRLRLQGCYIFNADTSAAVGTSSNLLLNNAATSNTAQSSALVSDCLVKSASNASGVVLVAHASGYVDFRRTELSNGRYALSSDNGTAVFSDCSFEISGAREVCRCGSVATTGLVVSLTQCVITNTATGGSGFSVQASNVTLGLGLSTFAVLPGSGYCVDGPATSTASTVAFGAGMTFAYGNNKVKNTLNLQELVSSPTQAA